MYRLLIGLSSIVTSLPGLALQEYTTRVNASNGGDPDHTSFDPCLSADGRRLVFTSAASDLVPGAIDGNGVTDIYVRELDTGVTRRVSMSFNGSETFAPSRMATISADGSTVAFASGDPTLVPGDVNQHWDVFVVDLASGATELVSRSSQGVLGNGSSFFPALSADGRYVAFETLARNFVAGDTNFRWDVYRHDRFTGETELVSRTPTGRGGNHNSGGNFQDGPSISADGRTVAFWSRASDLVPFDTNNMGTSMPFCDVCGDDIFVFDFALGSMQRLSVTPFGAESNAASYNPSLSADARFVAFESAASDLIASDTNGACDVFVVDRDSDGNGVYDEPGTWLTQLVSVASDGAQGNAWSGGTPFTRRGPTISADGKVVIFTSEASNLASGDAPHTSDLFRHDLSSGVTTCVSVDLIGNPAGLSFDSAPSHDGAVCAFTSGSTKLVRNDLTEREDVFVRRRAADPTLYCAAQVNSLGCTALFSSSGVPGPHGDPFVVTASRLRLNTQGFLVYSLAGAAHVPFGAGHLCLSAPWTRTQIGSTGNDGSGSLCGGFLTLDFDAWFTTGWGPRPASGEHVWVQTWSRDSGAEFGSNLSGGLEFVLAFE